MSIAELFTAPATGQAKRPFWRTATVSWSLTAASFLSLVAYSVIDRGYLRRDIEALQDGEAWRAGGWLSQVVLRVVSLIPGAAWQQLVLSLIACVACGFAFGALYDRLRANGWLRIGAFLVLAMLAAHAGVLYTFTASSRPIPLYIAFAALIPAIRSMEDVGDVQSAIGLGLLLPLLLLASPIAAPLVLPFAIGAALADRDGRSDPRAFVAMLLVAILPTIIVALGIIGFFAQSHIDLADALLPYIRAYSNLHFDPAMFVASLSALLAFAPALLVPIFYCLWPGVPERRHAFSALAVVVLPLYLVLARAAFFTTMTPMVPAVALMVAFVSWLAVARLSFALRLFAVALLALSVAASWSFPGIWNDAEWKAALFNFVPGDIGNLRLRPGV